MFYTKHKTENAKTRCFCLFKPDESVKPLLNRRIHALNCLTPMEVGMKKPPHRSLRLKMQHLRMKFCSYHLNIQRLCLKIRRLGLKMRRLYVKMCSYHLNIQSLCLKIRRLGLKMRSLHVKMCSLHLIIHRLGLKMQSLHIKLCGLQMKMYGYHLKIQHLQKKIRSLHLKMYSLHLKFFCEQMHIFRKQTCIFIEQMDIFTQNLSGSSKGLFHLNQTNPAGSYHFNSHGVDLKLSDYQKNNNNQFFNNFNLNTYEN